jgi:hypothetical protein
MCRVLNVIAIIVLILVLHTRGYEQEMETKPIVKHSNSSAEMSPPQCREFRNGRQYTGWVWLQRDGGKITGGCQYARIRT